MNEIATGYFLRLTPAEDKDFRLFLSDMDYTADSEGLRNFILDSIYEEEKEEENPILSAFVENPQAIKKGLDFVAGKINEKLFGTKKPTS